MEDDINYNAGIVAQHVNGFVKRNPDLLPQGRQMTPAAAFLLLCMQHKLDLTPDEAADAYTNGGGDAGVDGLHLGHVDMQQHRMNITLFQSKYHDNLQGNRAFPENAIRQLIGTLNVIFNPAHELPANDLLAPKIAEIHALIADGIEPIVHVALCNNGARWNDAAQHWIDAAQKRHANLAFSHFNHDGILHSLRAVKSVDATFQMMGKLAHENMDFKRVVIGRIPVQEIAILFDQHGDMLLQRNIRRFLGLQPDGYVNQAIADTLREKPENFYFRNNGITVVCDKLSFSGYQDDMNVVMRMTNMQIINGGQTCKTIHQVLSGNEAVAKRAARASVLLRIYQLPNEDKDDFVADITSATNNQNPVELRDLRSNDKWQKSLEIGIAALDAGYAYQRHRGERAAPPDTITSAVAAEATLAIWRQKPHLARFYKGQHFDTRYDEIFVNLHPAQALLAALILREVENERKRPKRPNPPLFLPYASHFIAMLMGRLLLQKLGIALDDIPKRDCKQLLAFFQENKDQLYAEAIQKVENAVADLLNSDAHSLQKLSATFRRSDLLGRL